MAKKEVLKKSVSNQNKFTNKPFQKKSMKNNDINKILVENFVSLQRVMTNLSVKFDNLSSQISKLLELFEISAKTIAEKDPKTNENHKDINKDIMEKIDNLLEQNKVIARGLTLIHENNSPREETRQPMQLQRPQVPPRQAPRPIQNNMEMRFPVKEQKSGQGFERYQKSMSHNSKNESEH